MRPPRRPRDWLARSLRATADAAERLARTADATSGPSTRAAELTRAAADLTRSAADLDRDSADQESLMRHMTADAR